jgi:hypothetical protein
MPAHANVLEIGAPGHTWIAGRPHTAEPVASGALEVVDGPGITEAASPPAPSAPLPSCRHACPPSKELRPHQTCECRPNDKIRAHA